MKQLIKPTKEQFEDFVFIRNSGVTNMYDTRTVCALSYSNLTEGICRYIMAHFLELAEEFNVEV